MSSSRLRSGKRMSSPALRALLWLAPALFALFVSKPAAAYPWMIKHGYSNCSTCHADPSGGELLTVYGRVMSDAFLSMQWKSEESAARAPRLRLALPIAARSKNALPRPELPLLAPFAQLAPAPPSETPADATPPARCLHPRRALPCR